MNRPDVLFSTTKSFTARLNVKKKGKAGTADPG